MKPVFLIYLKSFKKTQSRLAKDLARSTAELKLHPTSIAG